jgi:5'(3')-deoxyribonucleotidase
MDGVLSNFTKGCEQLFKVSLNPWPDKGNYDTAQILGISQNDFWKKITERGSFFWSDLEVYQEGRLLLEHCEKLVGKDNVAILTSPTLDPDCASGKMRWVNKHFPKFNRRILIGACKHICASKDAILIDDCDLNVQKFTTHGGNAVLFPRPWNSKHELQYSYVIERLKEWS